MTSLLLRYIKQLSKLSNFPIIFIILSNMYMPREAIYPCYITNFVFVIFLQDDHNFVQ